MNQSYQSPGEASLHYLPPVQQATANKQATQEAQKAVADALLTDKWSIGKTSTLSGKQIKAGTLMPNSYTTNTTGEKPTYTTTISFDPNMYTALFHDAAQEASRYLHQMPNCTQEQYIGAHLQAIQNAIITHTGATQEQAEVNLEKLTDTTLQQGETEIAGKAVKNNNAEVCTMKSMIAAYYLTEHCPTIDRTITATQGYEGGTDGHQYISFSHQGKQYAYHPNSPVHGKPNISAV